MVALAGFQALLARYSGQEEVVVGVPVAGRTRPEVEGLVGFFVNTLALRVGVGGDPSFRELVGRAREAALGGYAHQDAPFERVVEAVGGEREGAGSPVFQVMLAWQNAPAGRAEADGLHITPENIESTTSKFDLSLVLWEEGEGVGGYVEYSTDLYERETVERMGRHLGALLAAAAADPDRRLSELQLLSGEETGGRQLSELFAPEFAAADLSAEELEGIVMEINRALDQ
jgi:non-ribosomal peptide synthetase component F